MQTYNTATLQASVDADGTSPPLVAAWRRRWKAETELAAAEAALKDAPHDQVGG